MLYDDLKSILDEYNWDDGFSYLIGFARESRLEEWNRFTDTLYHDILGGKYKRSNRQYKIPLTRVQKYNLKKKQIPKVF